MALKTNSPGGVSPDTGAARRRSPHGRTFWPIGCDRGGGDRVRATDATGAPVDDDVAAIATAAAAAASSFAAIRSDAVADDVTSSSARESSDG